MTAKAHAKADTPTPVCFVDTETTGLDPDLHEIWEVALITPDGRERDWQLPVDLGRADPMALKIGRYRERRHKVDYLTSLTVFAEEFAHLTDGLHLAGAVVSFDAERLRKLLRANGECESWHYHLVDVEALAAGCGLRTPPWNSDDLSKAVGVDPDTFDRHTALGDARWARAIYVAVLGPPA